MEPDNVGRVIMFGVLGTSGAALIWTARAAASGRLKRNGFAGIRIPSTMDSDEAWLAAHKRARRPMETAGWAAVAGAGLAIFPLSSGAVATIVIGGTLAITGAAIYGAVVGGRAANEVTDAQKRTANRDAT